MNTSTFFRIASFGAACVMTLTIMVGVNSMALNEPAPVAMARAASAPAT